MEEWLPPTPGGRPTAAEQVVEEPEAETESQRARGCRGSGGQGGAEGSGDRGEGGDLEIRGGAGATEDPGGAEGRKEPNGAGGTERRGAARRRGVLRRWRVDARPRRSRRDEGARWSWRIDGWRWRDTPAPATLEDGRPTGLAPYKQGAEGERRGCQTTEVEEAGAGGRAGIFEEWALEDLTPPPCPAHPQPRCRGRSSTPCSHRPRLAPSWWALSPALAPGLTGWAQLPGRSSAQSLGLALARRSRREMALRHRWAWAGAPWAGLWVRSGSGEIIHCANGEGRSVTRQSPLYEGGEILSRTIFGRQRSASGIQARIIEWAERVVRVAGGVSYTQEQSSMVLERSVPLLQQEEKEFGPDEGIHGDTRRKQKTEKKPINKTEGKRRGNVVVGWSFCPGTQYQGARRRGIHKTKVFNKSKWGT